ncbi:MAG: 3-hydroxyacyl-CoA dehydrogenase, partial [uncultured Acetobacteraceae bacterium]
DGRAGHPARGGRRHRRDRGQLGHRFSRPRPGCRGGRPGTRGRGRAAPHGRGAVAGDGGDGPRARCLARPPAALRRLARGSGRGRAVRAGERAGAAGRSGAGRRDPGDQLLHHHRERDTGRLRSLPRTRRARPPVQPAAPDPAGGGGRRARDDARVRGAGARLLPGARQAPHPPPQGGARPRRQPLAGGDVAGGVPFGRDRSRQRGGRGRRDRARPRPALGLARPVPEPAPVRRPGRHRRAVRQAALGGHRVHVARPRLRVGGRGAGAQGRGRCGGGTG